MSGDGGPFQAGKSAYKTVSEILLAGVAVIVPIVITVYVLRVALGFVNGALQPVIGFLDLLGVFAFVEATGLLSLLAELGLYRWTIGLLTEFIALIALVGLIVLIGSIVYHPWGQRLVDYFDIAIESIPGIGTVYRSFRRMGDIMLDDDVENFQEVNLVELHGEGTYVIGFRVGESPGVVQDATGGGMVTMFIPFAPNPVTGGFLTYVPADRLHDIDMTVEEGVRNIITSGVSGHESAQADIDLAIETPVVQEVIENGPDLTDSADDASDDRRFRSESDPVRDERVEGSGDRSEAGDDGRRR